MKRILTLLALNSFILCYGQLDNRISTVEFVQILNNNKTEADYYYQNNWKILREMALQSAYIHSYELLETPFDETGPYHFILITTYTNEKQYALREEHFEKLIKEKGPLQLLNAKKPEVFRKRVMGKEGVRHWKQSRD